MLFKLTLLILSFVYNNLYTADTSSCKDSIDSIYEILARGYSVEEPIVYQLIKSPDTSYICYPVNIPTYDPRNGISITSYQKTKVSYFSHEDPAAETKYNKIQQIVNGNIDKNTLFPVMIAQEQRTIEVGSFQVDMELPAIRITIPLFLKMQIDALSAYISASYAEQSAYALYSTGIPPGFNFNIDHSNQYKPISPSNEISREDLPSCLQKFCKQYMVYTPEIQQLLDRECVTYPARIPTYEKTTGIPITDREKCLISWKSTNHSFAKDQYEEIIKIIHGIMSLTTQFPIKVVDSSGQYFIQWLDLHKASWKAQADEHANLSLYKRLQYPDGSNPTNLIRSQIHKEK